MLEVIRLADRFDFTLLKDALGDYLMGRTNNTNVLQILVNANLYHLSKLYNHCLGCIDTNAAMILESEALLSLPEDRSVRLLLEYILLCVCVYMFCLGI